MKKTCTPLPLARPALAFLSILVLLASACSPATDPGPASTMAAAKPAGIKIAILPIIDALPMYVATEQGYFTERNVDITFIPAASAAERDQLVTAGESDGMINDLLSVALYNRDEIRAQVVRFAMVATSKNAMFRVLAAKDSGLKTPADLAGVPIGMSEGTVIDYVTSRMLEKEGLSGDQIQSIAVPKMNERMALLASGEIKAATLPEPFGTMALEGGAVPVVDDTRHPEYSSSVVTFRKAFIDEQPQAVEGFLYAYEQAVEDINQDPEKWRPLLSKYKLVPEQAAQTFPMPVFPPASIPTEAQFQDVVSWAKERAMIERDMPYASSVTSQFLPE